MKIRELEPTSKPDLAGWIAVGTAARSFDAPSLPPPCRQDLEGGMAVPWPGRRQHHWVAEDAGQIVGTLALYFPEFDNRDNVDMELAVRPESRRHGIGTTLLRTAVDETRREGRKRIIVESVRTVPGGPPRPGAGAGSPAPPPPTWP